MSYLDAYYSPRAGMVHKRSLNIVVNTRMLLGNRLDGIGRLTYEVMKRLADLRPNDNFYCLYDRHHEEYVSFGPHVHPIVIRPAARHPILWKIWFDIRIPRLLKKLNADCFISLDGFNAKQKLVPSIIIGHDIAPLHFPQHMKGIHARYFKKYLPRFLENANAIVANSHFTKEDICETIGVKPSKVHVAYSGLNPCFTPISASAKETIQKRHTQGRPYFVFVGTRSPRKNLARLVQAFEEFKWDSQREHQLMIIGKPGWKDDTFQNQIGKCQFKTEIQILEEVDNVDIYSMVAAAEAAVFVSLYEGFGLPIIEAMSAGVPVITSNVSAMPEVAGDAAILVNPESVSEISKAMLTISDDADLRTSLIQKGLIQCQQFNWDDQANKISELIDEVV